MELHVVVALRIVAAIIANTIQFKRGVMFHSSQDVNNCGSPNVHVRHVHALIYVEERSKRLDGLLLSLEQQ